MSAEYRTTGEIEAELARNRDDLKRSLAMLSDRVSVRGAIDAAKAAFAQNGAQAADIMSRSVRTNPLAVAMVGLGLMWLVAGPDLRPVKPRSGVLRTRRRQEPDWTKKETKNDVETSVELPRVAALRSEARARDPDWMQHPSADNCPAWVRSADNRPA